MTRLLTDGELDGALRALGTVLDRETDAGADRARLSAARARLVVPPVVDAHLDEHAEVLEIAARHHQPRRPRGRVAAAVLAIAALAAGIALAAVLWPHSAGRTVPLGPAASAEPTVPRVRSSQQWLARDLGLLPRPLPAGPDAQVLFETSGRGDALFGDAWSVDAAQGAGRVLTYSYVCGDPSPAATDDPDGPTFRLTDNLGGTATTSCYPIGGGQPAHGWATLSPPSVAGRTGIRVQTPNPDVVWRLVVSIGPR